MLKKLTESKARKAISLAKSAMPPIPKEGETVDLFSLSAKQLAKVLAITKEEKALCKFLKKLSDAEMSELMALFWLGRGGTNRDKNDFKVLVQRASRELDDAVSYLAGKQGLGENIERGLRKTSN